MKELEKQFFKKGFRFTQMWRDNKFAIFLKENNVPVEAENYYFSYELIKIRIKKKDQIANLGGNEVIYPAGEYYPTDRDWGSSGWSCFSENEAMILKTKIEAADLEQTAIC